MVVELPVSFFTLDPGTSEMEEHSLTLVRSTVLETFRQEGLYIPAFAGHARGRSAKAENPDNNSGIKKLKNKEKQGTKVCYGSLLQLSKNLLEVLSFGVQ